MASLVLRFFNQRRVKKLHHITTLDLFYNSERNASYYVHAIIKMQKLYLRIFLFILHKQMIIKSSKFIKIGKTEEKIITHQITSKFKL